MAGADGDVERDGQGRGAAHLLADQGLECLAFAGEDVEDELVVDLEQHPRLQTLGDQTRVDAEHGDLDQVGGRPLDRAR